MISLRTIRILLIVAICAAGPVRAQTSVDFAEVDDLRDRGEFQEAMNRLEALQSEGAERSELLWRIAWTRVDIGEETDDRAEQAALYRTAVDEARRAVELEPDNAWAHMVRGIAVGRAALTAGTRERIELSREVREAADEAIRLDDSLDGAYHVRGRWHHEVASLGFISRNVVRLVYGGLPEASFELAIEDFRRAVRLEDRVVHRLELGRTYLEVGNRSEARVHLEQAVDMEDDDPKAPRYRDEARDLLRRAR